MKKYQEYQKVVSILMTVIMIISTSGCYSLKNLSKNDIQSTNRTVYMLHGLSVDYKLINANISDGVFTGKIDYVVYVPDKAKTIHIYANSDSVIKKSGDFVSVPFRDIAKVEEYKINGAKTFEWVIAPIAVIALILIVKGASCPFIYTNDGDNYQFTGEIYSGATSLPTERDDYLPISNLKPVDSKYKLRITNEVEEIQNTNLTELITIDHKPGIKILMDKIGNAYSISDLKIPTVATDSYGSSILNELSSCDSLRYISTIKKDSEIRDTISLTFDKPAGATSSTLIIKGKNTMWLDYMYGRFTDLFGNRFEKWKEKNDKAPREELLKWSFDQGMPLSVYLKTDTGLKFVDYFNIAGPMADKEDIIQIDLSGVHSNKVNLKLVSGFLFWDIDFAGMDFSSTRLNDKTIIPLLSAIDEKGNDVRSLLIKDDEKYLIQPLPVNKTDLSFHSTEIQPGMERSLFLHSKGHYEILRDTKGKPDMAYLKTFLEPGAFIKFSKDHFLKYYYRSN